MLDGRISGADRLILGPLGRAAVKDAYVTKSIWRSSTSVGLRRPDLDAAVGEDHVDRFA